MIPTQHLAGKQDRWAPPDHADSTCHPSRDRTVAFLVAAAVFGVAVVAAPNAAAVLVVVVAAAADL